MTKQVLVIGGGPGGIEAARTAARAGAKVTLIADGPVGGRAGWHSLLPSKVWLAAVEGHGRGATPERILTRLESVRSQWNEQQTRMLTDLAVTIVMGSAAFVGSNRVEVVTADGLVQFDADHIIVAAGSVPIFPAGLKPDGERVIAPRFMSGLTELPRSIVVIGAGSTGCEFAYLFNALGVDVSWVVDEYGVLPAYHPDAGRFLTESLIGRGVRLFAGQSAVTIERSQDGARVQLADGTEIATEMAFAAVGRKPDEERLQLARAGLDPNKLTVDGFGRTANPDVYLVGDSVGVPMVANKATAQGRVAALHALGLNPEPFDVRTLLLATYTAPEIAQIGDARSPDLLHARLAFGDVLKPWLLPQQSGFVDVAYDPQTRQVMGGLAAGYHAADVLSPLIVALQQHMTIDALAGLFGAHPTIGELVFAAARQAATRVE